MQVNTNHLISITKANQNFSQVTKMVDTNGAAVIMKNNQPRYIVLEYQQVEAATLMADDTVTTAGKRYLAKHKAAFEELAK